jgi:two-component system, cell cycle response regulator
MGNVLHLLRRLAMSNPHKIALIGFSSFERATFESFFRLAARRPPGYVLVVDPAIANLAVVNADDPVAMSTVLDKKPCKHVMLIGTSDSGTGWTLQNRPLNLMKVLTNVEQLLSPSGPTHGSVGAPASAPARVAAPVAPLASAVRSPVEPSGFFTTRSFAKTDAAPLMPFARAPTPPRPSPVIAPPPPPVTMRPAPSVVLPMSRRGDVRVGSGNQTATHSGLGMLGGNSQSPSIVDDGNVDHILVVDDSDIALKFMRNRLTRFGFRTDLANSGEEALGRLGVRPYKFVFLDVMMEGLDGYQTCRAIKQRKYGDEKPPVVVMLTSRGGTIDKIRGTLAGCDAYLTKPLNERDLIAILSKHDRNVARGFQSTDFGRSAKPGSGVTTARSALGSK